MEQCLKRGIDQWVVQCDNMVGSIRLPDLNEGQIVHGKSKVNQNKGESRFKSRTETRVSNVYSTETAQHEKPKIQYNASRDDLTREREGIWTRGP
jgi:hypothetical protein